MQQSGIYPNFGIWINPAPGRCLTRSARRERERERLCASAAQPCILRNGKTSGAGGEGACGVSGVGDVHGDVASASDQRYGGGGDVGWAARRRRVTDGRESKSQTAARRVTDGRESK